MSGTPGGSVFLQERNGTGASVPGEPEKSKSRSGAARRVLWGIVALAFMIMVFALPEGGASIAESAEGIALPESGASMAEAFGAFALPESGASMAEAFGAFALPEDSSSFSKEFALRMLACSSGYGEADTRRILEAAGFEPVLQAHYDKAAEDPSHTCAFMLGKRGLPEGRTVYLLLIRGTWAGEWYSNFDVAPSGSGETRWAENFLGCAEDVLLRIRDALEADPEALWVVTGHSRGAACANVLGLMLNTLRDPSLNYIYTSATPATLRGEAPSIYDGNIFNLINPMDLVPKLPLAAWGYRRAGTDIVLPGMPAGSAKLENMVDTLAALAPTLEEYYTARHLLTGPGTGEEGFTAFDVLILLADTLSNMTLSVNEDGSWRAETENSAGGALEGLSEESDLYPLSRILESMSGEDGQRLLEQHLPTAYIILLNRMK